MEKQVSFALENPPKVPKNRGRKRGRAKSRALLRETVTDWIKANIFTKEKVLVETEDEDEYVIQEVPTKAFGVIDFKGASRKTKAKFAQISDETPAEVLVELFSKWKIARPQIMIAVTGGAKSFKANDHLKETLAEGLRKIAQSPGTWITTGGTNTGIMKFVGESLQGVSNSIIGIATWGVIANSERLLPNYFSPLGGTFEYEVANSIIEEGAFLDHNHSYFLLVDDASTGEFGKEVSLCSRLMKHLTYFQAKQVPAVLLVFEGGFCTIDNILEAVTDTSAIPVVVVKGSGRVANIISYAVELLEEPDIPADVVDQEVRKSIEKNLPGLTLEENENIFSKVKKCMEHKKLITLFDANEQEGVDKSVLSAIFQSYEMTQGKKLQYSLVWNRVDIAKQLMVDKLIKWEKSDFENAMIMALVLNRYQFVELFMEHCIGVHKLVTQPLLEFLYGHRSTRHGSIVSNEIDDDNFIVFDDVHQSYFYLLRGVVYDNDTDLRAAKYIKYDGIEGLMSSLCDELKLLGNETFIATKSKFTDEKTCSEFPYLDLFIWAVVNNMQEMALFLWRLGEEQIAKAIVASQIYKKLAASAQEKGLSKELVERFSRNEKCFKDLAIGVLDKCSSKNTEKTKTLLTMQLVQFNSHNCLSLAHLASFEEFIAHTTVQQLLHELWNGHIEFENSRIKMKTDDNVYLAKRDVFGRPIEEISHRDATQANLIEQNRKKSNNNVISKANDSFMQDTVKHSSDEISRLRFVYNYYYCRPASKFYRNLVSYCCFLLLIAYVSMVEKTSTTPSIAEIILFVWVVALTFEEIYQIAITPGRTLLHKLEDYFGNVFNAIDAFAIVTYFIAFGMQLSTSLIEYGHLLYAINSMFWIARLLQYFYANPILGPYVLMIGKMFIDMCYFISILGVFLLAYGVLSASILKPQNGKIFSMIKDVIFHPYFNIYGELFLERDADPGKTRFGTVEINNYAETISIICLGLFLLIANVLLLNLLIAIFGNTFSQVQEKSDQIWKFNLYGLITEYALKPQVTPPLTIFFHIWMFARWLFRRSWGGKSATTASCSTTSDIRREEVEEFQMKNVFDVIREQKVGTDYEAISKKLEDITNTVRDLQNQFSQMQMMNKSKENSKFSFLRYMSSS